MEMGGQQERKERLICSSCGNAHAVETQHSVDVSANPELKDKIRSGEFFVWECPHCGAKNLHGDYFLYHDPAEKLLIMLSSRPLNVAEELPGYTCRRVSSVGELIEKVNIFDAGLDDVVIEMCKYIARHELNKDMELKFYRLGGADSFMTFTYPENGRMEMVELGFKVYSECAGIIKRNPSIRASLTGFAVVDSAWLSQFFA